MVKPHREVCFSFNNRPEFFKVYLPELSSHRLRIPPAFIKIFNGNIPNKVILRDLTRKSWHAEVERVKRNVFINNGWQDFASDHSLELGHFLVFSYDGNSLFDVKIFGKDGCKKEELKEDEQTRRDLTRACKRKHSEIGLSGAGQYESRRTALLNLNKGNACIAAEHIAPKDLRFVATITESSLFLQHVPRLLVESNGIKLKPDVTLRDKNGKSWPVKINSWKDGRIFLGGGLGGWFNFRENNKLRLGDKCVFEFILGSGRICEEMQVQILHAAPKTQKAFRCHQTRKA